MLQPGGVIDGVSFQVCFCGMKQCWRLKQLLALLSQCLLNSVFESCVAMLSSVCLLVYTVIQIQRMTYEATQQMIMSILLMMVEVSLSVSQVKQRD